MSTTQGAGAQPAYGSGDAPLTEAEFARQVSYMAREATGWAGDTLGPVKAYESPMDHETVARFTDGIRGRCDRLDAWAGRPPQPEGEVRRLRAVLATVMRELERLSRVTSGEARAAIEEVRATVARGNGA